MSLFDLLSNDIEIERFVVAALVERRAVRIRVGTFSTDLPKEFHRRIDVYLYTRLFMPTFQIFQEGGIRDIGPMRESHMPSARAGYTRDCKVERIIGTMRRDLFTPGRFTVENLFYKENITSSLWIGVSPRPS